MEQSLAEAFEHVEGIGSEIAFLEGVFEFLAKKRPGFMRSSSAVGHVTKIARKWADQANKQQAAQAPPVVPAPKQMESTSELPQEPEQERSEEAEPEARPPPPVGNGGTTDKYTWTQTLSEVTIMVPIPATATSKSIRCQISATRMKLALADSPTPLLDGQFPQRVVGEDSTWTIETDRAGKKTLTIYLPKVNQMSWWDCILEGEPKIDTKAIVPENSKLQDLDGETRATVEKMMYDQRQKAMGLPTSEDQQKQEMLQKFMKAHPEMDFSNVKIN
ncbi:CS domain-containing protein [Plasmodiophora brassicae]